MFVVICILFFETLIVNQIMLFWQHWIFEIMEYRLTIYCFVQSYVLHTILEKK